MIEDEGSETEHRFGLFKYSDPMAKFILLPGVVTTKDRGEQQFGTTMLHL